MSLGFPFAPNFIEKIHSIKSNDKSSKRKAFNKEESSIKDNRNNKNFKFDKSDNLSEERSLTIDNSPKSLYCLTSSCKSRNLVICNSELLYYFVGNGKITPIRGVLNANGYYLQMGIPEKVCAPSWLPAIRLQIESLSSKNTISSVSIKYKLRDEFYKICEFDDITFNNFAMFIHEPINEEDSSWIELAETLPLIPPNCLNDVSICETSIILQELVIQRFRLKTFQLLESWVNTGTNILNKRTENPKILICGAKGSGKSTSVRYYTNRLLNKCKAVCILDCDVGQPEFSVPGMLSLYLIRDPILFPTHIHIHHHQPILSFFYGDIQTKNDPYLFSQAIQKLYSAYETIRSEFHQFGELKEVADLLPTSNILQSNKFSILDSNDSKSEPLPLIINCDGNIRFSGAMILSSIINIVNPSIVIHLVTQKDKDLLSFNELSSSAQIIPVEPGQIEPSRIHAYDLRNLRIISYFLFHDITLKEYVKSHNVGEIESRINICNGIINDPQGYLAYAMMRLKPFSIPFQNMNLISLQNEKATSMTIALLNASIVGILQPHVDVDVSLEFTIERFNDQRNDKKFELKMKSSLDSDFTLPPCLGIGLVRSIDVSSQRLFVLTPINKISSIDNKVILARGSIPIPSTLTNAPGLLCYPYATNEAFGEGSSNMKHRTNVKRHYQ